MIKRLNLFLYLIIGITLVIVFYEFKNYKSIKECFKKKNMNNMNKKNMKNMKNKKKKKNMKSLAAANLEMIKKENDLYFDLSSKYFNLVKFNKKALNKLYISPKERQRIIKKLKKIKNSKKKF